MQDLKKTTAHDSKSFRIRTYILGTLVIVLFQNCTKVAFHEIPKPETIAVASSLPEAPPAEVLKADDFLVQGKFNNPIDFTYKSLSSKGPSLKISFSDKEDLSLLDAKQGRYEILNSSTFLMRYTPTFGFRGQKKIQVYIKDANNRIASAGLTVVVGNNLNQVQPAIAMRASGCITCHATIGSNYITDFGYGGDGANRDYFFGKGSPSPWNSGSIYGDHGKSFSTLIFLDKNSQVIAPMAPITGAPADASGEKTLAGYLQSQLKQSTNEITKSILVSEKSKVFIGAPTTARIEAAFQLSPTDANLKFLKENADSTEFSGIEFVNGIYRNTGPVTCDGDLVIRGLLFLENLKLSSLTGCRIYVTETVLLYGPIDYLNKTDNTNLQITSARAISLGLGSVLKDNLICESKGEWYYDTYTNPANAAVKEKYNSSLLHRFQTLWTIPSHFTREDKIPLDVASDVYQDALKIQTALGTPLLDARCRSEGRDVSFERLLLNAPQVQSRYRGAFSGVIISEVGLMSLSTFVFKYDSVFNNNTALPLLDEKDFLVIEN